MVVGVCVGVLVFFVELVVSPDMTCDRFSDIVVCVCGIDVS